jgi:hypothetical protein
MTVLLLSLSDVSQIPDGNLFCCAFTSSAPPNNPCCSLSTGGVGLSDATGQVPLGDADAVLQVSVGGVPCTTASVSGSQGSGAGAMPQPGYNAAPAAPPPAVQIPAPGAPQGGAPAGSLGQAPPARGNTESAEPAVEVSGQATETPPRRDTAPQRTTTAPLSPTVRRETSPARSATATAPAQTPGEPTATPKPHKVK